MGGRGDKYYVDSSVVTKDGISFAPGPKAPTEVAKNCLVSVDNRKCIDQPAISSKKSHEKVNCPG